jgi:CHAD domain-containing protein
MAKPWKIPHLNLNMHLDSALKKILTARLNEMQSYEEDTLKGEDPEVLHSMRVTSRRIQAVMKIFREAFPAKSFEKEYENIKAVKNSLGEVRNRDVFIEKLEEFVKLHEHPDKRAINLLIARQKILRESKRNLMKRTLTGLNKKHYREKFLDFTDKEL